MKLGHFRVGVYSRQRFNLFLVYYAGFTGKCGPVTDLLIIALVICDPRHTPSYIYTRLHHRISITAFSSFPSLEIFVPFNNIFCPFIMSLVNGTYVISTNASPNKNCLHLDPSHAGEQWTFLLGIWILMFKILVLGFGCEAFGLPDRVSFFFVISLPTTFHFFCSFELELPRGRTSTRFSKTIPTRPWALLLVLSSSSQLFLHPIIMGLPFSIPGILCQSTLPL